MANYVFKDGKIILRCSKGTMELLHDYLCEIIKKEHLEVSQDILDFVEQIDQDIYGRGVIHVDLEDVIKTRESLSKLQQLTAKSIDSIKEKEALDILVANRVVTNLEKFRDNLIQRMNC